MKKFLLASLISAFIFTFFILPIFLGLAIYNLLQDGDDIKECVDNRGVWSYEKSECQGGE
jgi:hypothetical protein